MFILLRTVIRGFIIEVKFRMNFDDNVLISLDSGNASLLTSSSVDRAKNRFGDENSFCFLSVCYRFMGEGEDKLHLNLKQSSVFHQYFSYEPLFFLWNRVVF